MAKSVADRWVTEQATREYRFAILGFGHEGEVRKLAGYLRSWRDGKVRLASMEPIVGLGVRETSDGLEVWSPELDPMRRLAEWVEGKGFDTSFIW